jgi:hypothetical protein
MNTKMKASIFFSFLLLMTFKGYGQNIKLIIDNIEYSGKRIENGVIDFADAEAMLVPIDKLKKIYSDIEYYKIKIREDSVQISEYKKIIASCENFEEGADKLINKQESMLTTADSLYKGYKILYHDLKKLCSINSFSIIPGMGFTYIQDIDPKLNLAFSLGFEYNKINLNAIIGKKYQGATIGYRIGF